MLHLVFIHVVSELVGQFTQGVADPPVMTVYPPSLLGDGLDGGGHRASSLLSGLAVVLPLEFIIGLQNVLLAQGPIPLRRIFDGLGHD